MSDHPRLRSFLAGVATAAVFAVSLLPMAHLCDRNSIWLQMPLMLFSLLFFPAWIRRAAKLRWVAVRSLLSVAAVVALQLGFLTWLHSDAFPRWLLFPKPRPHKRMAAAPAITRLPAEDRKVLRDASRFSEIAAATNLPPAVLALCADSRGRLAEPGQQWQATDAITDDTLPTKRLIWAATDGDYHVVHYERGGRGHSFQVLVARLKAGESQPGFIWRGVGGPLNDYGAFLDALTSSQLDDRSDYAP